MTAPGILGILGFSFAVLLGILELHRYHVPLQLRVREVDLAGSSRDTFLVLLRVTFVNAATRGRTVYHIRVAALDKEVVSQPHYEYSEDYDTLTYGLPNAPNVKVDLPFDEKLQLPLDIPPHQSRSGWFAIAIQRESEVAGIPKIHLLLSAENISRKLVAKYDEEVELGTHAMP